MTQVVAGKFHEFVLETGDGEDPEVFNPMCGLTSRGIQFSSNTNKTTLPDCDPTVVSGWEGVNVVSKGATMPGSGVAPMDKKNELFSWWKSASGKNCKLKVVKPLAAGGGHWLGLWVMTALDFTAEEGGFVNFSYTLEADGEVTWVDASS